MPGERKYHLPPITPSRRAGFISLGLLASGFAGREAYHFAFYKAVEQITKDATPEEKDLWQRAKAPTAEFLEANREVLNRYTLGTNISLQRLNWYFHSIYKRTLSDNEIARVIDIAANDYGFSDVRFSIYWHETNPQKGRVDFSHYRKIFSQMAKNNMKVLPIVGLKGLSHPEFYVPDWVENQPPKGSLIKKDSPVAHAFLSYSDRLLNFLQEYSDLFDTVQIENETYQRVGDLEWIMGDDYLEELMLKVLAKFPDKKVMLNSLDVDTSDQVNHFFKTMILKHPELHLPGKLASGANLFFMTPWRFKIPKMGYLPGINDFDGDSLVRSTLPFDAEKFQKNIEFGRLLGVENTFVSELQFNDWPGVGFPKDNPDFARLQLLLCPVALDPQKHGKAYVWQMEDDLIGYMVGRVNPGQEEKRELISGKNGKAPITR